MSKFEDRVYELWLEQGGPPLERQYGFAEPLRKYRADFAHVPTKVLIECQGGVYSHSKYARGAGIIKDCERSNIAARLGWHIVRIPGYKDWEKDGWVEQALEIVRARGG